MSTVRQPSAIAVLISDLHLTLLQPACRNDKDWMATQAGYLAQVREIAHGLPVICAGDIFDKWNAAPELINFALQHLPDEMICVPGQHDLPNHRMDLMHRSGYGVLKEVRKILDLSSMNGPLIPEEERGLIIHGFGWDQPILGPSHAAFKDELNIAVIHRYVWTADKKYPDAPASSNVSALKKDLEGYDVAVFGDNHISFAAKAGDCTVINVGGFIRRKTDEMDAAPSVGVLYDNGTVKRVRLDISGDVFHAPDKVREEMPFDMKGFVDGLASLGEHGLNFREAVENYLEKEEINPKTKEIVLQALEGK